MKKQLRSSVAWVCVLSLFLSFSPLAAAYDVTVPSWSDEEAAWVASHPQLNETLAWTLDEETGTLTIDGEGWMNTGGLLTEDYAPWIDEFRETEVLEDGTLQLSEDAGFTRVVIADGIKNVGYCAFAGCGGLQEVYLPSSILYIGRSAFFSCPDLKSVNLQEGIQHILNDAFYNCGMESIKLPSSLTMVSKSAFAFCYNLQRISIPSHVEYIGEEAFANCQELNEIILPKSLSFLGENVFTNCFNLTDIYYEGSEEEWNELLGTERKDMSDFSDIIIHFNYQYPLSDADNEALVEELQTVLASKIADGLQAAGALAYTAVTLSRMITAVQQIWSRYGSSTSSFTKWVHEVVPVIDNHLKQQIAEIQNG